MYSTRLGHQLLGELRDGKAYLPDLQSFEKGDPNTN
jgi:hypothetical protein